MSSQPTDVTGFITKCYNPEIHRDVHSSPACDVAESLLACRSDFTDGEWDRVELEFGLKTKYSMQEAVSLSMGRGKIKGEYIFGAQFHDEKAEE